MEGTAHIDFPRFETNETIKMKILPVIQRDRKYDFLPNLEVVA